MPTIKAENEGEPRQLCIRHTDLAHGSDDVGITFFDVWHGVALHTT
jgi:hypothetical protein